jgi:hypothetical protein
VLTGYWFGLSSTLDDETRELLAEHQKMLRDPDARESARRKALESKLRRRLGSFGDTSIDRMVQSIASQLLDESYRELGAEERLAVRNRILELARERDRPREG